MWVEGLRNDEQNGITWWYTQQNLKNDKSRKFIQPDDGKKINLRLIGVRAKLEEGTYRTKKNLFTGIAENSPCMGKELNIQISEVIEHPTICDFKKKKKSSPWYIIVKTSEVQQKDRYSKAVREKQNLTYKGKPSRIIGAFST